MDTSAWNNANKELRLLVNIMISTHAHRYTGTEEEQRLSICRRREAAAICFQLPDFTKADIPKIFDAPTFTEEDLWSFLQRQEDADMRQHQPSTPVRKPSAAIVVPGQLHAGMGGAAEHGPRTPIIDPRHEITVYDEVIERSGVERSVSASDGVGVPLHDPEEAMRRISDPAIRKEWWPKVPTEPPAAPIPAPQPSLRKST